MFDDVGPCFPKGKSYAKNFFVGKMTLLKSTENFTLNPFCSFGICHDRLLDPITLDNN